jgi:Flp pilus assembly protein CpaB
MSQTNQIIAMLFPLLALVVAGLTAIVVRKPWRQKAISDVQTAGITTAIDVVGTGVLVAAKDLERRAHNLAQDLERTLVR